jgi:hypothetical protein
MVTEMPKYHVLTPKTDLVDEVYFGAIDYALKDKSVHNIAVTGPYGSGKSSVIHSYIKKRKEDDKAIIGGEWPIRDITITLAHICEEEDVKEVENGTPKPRKAKKQKIDQNLIQYSILEQLFFHDSGANLPESQFSRIKPLSWWDLMAYVFYIVFFGVCVFAWFYRNTFGLNYPVYLALLIFSVLSSYAVYKLLPIIRNLSVRKISLATASIEVGKGVEPSVLNKHLDEILYFFQQTRTNLVVFEDLDRFDNPDLFVKLREINYLINNATNIEQNVVFVYALRDDMFMNKQRTKFFDFIVPIIPYVDGKNAVDKLYAEMGEGGIDERLCHVLSLHIGDMRMVYNIANEYQVYFAKKSNEANFDKNRLLAIVAYKNCYPKDFAALLDRKGILYAIMNGKENVISKETQDTKAEIEKLEAKAQEIRDHRQSSIKSLRLEYLNAILMAIPFKGARLGWIDSPQHLDDWTKDEEFKTLLSRQMVEYVYQIPRNRAITQDTMSFDFKEIEKQVDPKYTYKQREQLICEQDKLEEIEDKIRDLHSKIAYAEGSRYFVLLDDGFTLKGKFDECRHFAENEEVFEEQVALIEDLLAFDFINENYMEYVSLFHEGIMGKKERRFLIDVLRRNHNPYDYKLEKAEQVVERLEEDAFLESSVWNFDIVDALMSSDAVGKKTKNLMCGLSDTDGGLEFIDEYVNKGTQVGRFIEELCEEYPNVWRNFHNTPHVHYDEMQWRNLILRFARLEHIPKVFDQNEAIIANDAEYFSIENIPVERLRDIADLLNMKFTEIKQDETFENKEFVYKKNLYALSPAVIENIIPFEYDNNIFKRCNIATLYDKSFVDMFEYVKENIQTYIQNVWLKFPDAEDPCEYMLELIKLSKGKVEQTQIIHHFITRVKDINDILEDDDYDVEVFFAESAVEPTWDNMKAIFTYEEENLSDYVVNYLNQQKIYAALFGSVKQEFFSKNSTSDDTKLAKAILYSPNLSGYALNAMLDSNIRLKRWEAAKLSEEKVIDLADSRKISFELPTLKFLREEYVGAFVHILKGYFAEVVRQFDSTISLTSEEIDLLAKANLHTLQYKKLLPYIKADAIKKAKRLTFVITAAERKDKAITFEKAIAIVTNKNVDPQRRINVLLNWEDSIKKDDISDYLQALGEPYSSIPANYAKIPKSDLNRMLLECLRRKEYMSSFPLKKDSYYRVYNRIR